MKVNIVMLVKDRAKLTFQALRTLHQNTPADLFNLTIVNDCSKTNFHWDAMEHLNLSVITIENGKGITGQARNLGIYWAEKYWGRGDYLYLTDNDVYFTPGWLDKMTRVFDVLRIQFTDVSILGGWNHPFLQPNTLNHIRMGDFNICSHDAVTGASQLMRWPTWNAFGPLDAHAPGVGQSEDWAFCQKIIKDGGRVASMYPRVVFNCGLTNSLGQPSPGANVMFEELLEAKKTYPDLYWE